VEHGDRAQCVFDPRGCDDAHSEGSTVAGQLLLRVLGGCFVEATHLMLCLRNRQKWIYIVFGLTSRLLTKAIVNPVFRNYKGSWELLYRNFHAGNRKCIGLHRVLVSETSLIDVLL
jgi:hypothetical protein